MPSICIILTLLSWIRSFAWIHTWISFAVMRGFDVWKEQTTVLSRSAILYEVKLHHNQQTEENVT